ncbi:MAG TPA: acetyl-CoA C-acetyltransferase [Candidatus Xenobia bacterium]|jgi:acetyl-CoA C-acetyltransferase
MSTATVTKFPEPQLQQQHRPRRARPIDQMPVIVGACRTPIGKFLGAFAEVPAPVLASHAIREALKRAGVAPEEVDQVILGNVLSAGVGQNPARQAALKAGLPSTVSCVTVNQVCASGLQSVAMACQAILAGDVEVVVAGGMENMSRAPYLLDRARTGYRLGHGQILDSMISDGLWCAFNDFHMGQTGELVSEYYGLSRQMQDEYALNSHMKAVKAQKEGHFQAEIVPVPVPGKKGEILVDKDESPREDSTIESLGKLRAAFKEGGTVTAGNAPGVNDGAAAVVVMSAQKARELGKKPLARVNDFYTAGLDPAWVMLTPIPAVRGLLARNVGWKLDDFDLLEVNEAFSVQALAVAKELGIQPERLNVHGGAVALGHPIGASGARILVSLLYGLQQHDKRKGLATLCLGGGNGLALAVERV